MSYKKRDLARTPFNASINVVIETRPILDASYFPPCINGPDVSNEKCRVNNLLVIFDDHQSCG